MTAIVDEQRVNGRPNGPVGQNAPRERDNCEELRDPRLQQVSVPNVRDHSNNNNESKNTIIRTATARTAATTSCAWHQNA